MGTSTWISLTGSHKNKSYAEIPDSPPRATTLQRWVLVVLNHIICPDVKQSGDGVHLLPNFVCARMMVSSSSAVNARCSTYGESRLHHHSWHNFLDLLTINLLIKDQFRMPCFSNNLYNSSFSSACWPSKLIWMRLT